MEQASADRRRQISSQRNEPHSELGVQFESVWAQEAFSALYAVPSRNGIYMSAEFQGSGTRIVNMGEMFGIEFITDQEMSRVRLSDPELRVSGLEDGDLLFGRRSIVEAGAGKCSLVVSPSEPLTFESSLIRVRLRPDRSVPLFYYYYFASPTGRENVRGIVAGTNVKGIRATELGQLLVPVPDIGEQRSVAAALGSVDALVDALDKVIAKKRGLKQAAMQQLLTGHTRMPGFSSVWETKRLGDIASIRNHKVMPSAVPAETPCIELEHIGQADGRLLAYAESRQSTSSKYRFCKGDVLFGRLRAYLRKYWLADRSGICTTEIWPLAVFPEHVKSGYLYAIVQSDRFIEEAGISYGTHMPRADWAVMRKLELQIPEAAEQTAIATVFHDMDAELAALEARREKTRAIKQGMMQELLTGRIRLV